MQKQIFKLYKIIVLGSTAVGKTQLINRLVDNKYEENFLGTIGVDFKVKNMQVHGKEVRLQIWDSPMNFRRCPYLNSYFPGTNGALILFSPDDHTTFDDAKYLYEIYTELALPNSSVVLVGSRCDMLGDKYFPRRVKIEEISAFTEEHKINYIEVSSKENINVYQAFQLLLDDIYSKTSKDIEIESNANSNKQAKKESKKKPKEKKIDHEINTLKLELSPLKTENEQKQKQIKQMSDENNSLRDNLEILSRKLEAAEKIEKERLRQIKKLEEQLQEIENKEPQKLKNFAQSSKNNEFQFLDAESMDQITKIKRIGKGSMSVVYLVSREKYYALKVFNDFPVNEMKNFVNFYEILNGLQHQNIAKICGICVGDKNHPPSLLLDYYPSNLKDSIQFLDNGELISIILEIVETMIQIHSLGIFHRNLKPENILIDSNKHVKLSDFKFFEQDKQETHQRDAEFDVFSFGAVLYFIASRGIGSIESFNSEIISESTNLLISKCQSGNPSERPSFKEIFKYIQKNKLTIL